MLIDLFVAGDFCNNGTDEEMAGFNDFLGGVNYAWKLVVTGIVLSIIFIFEKFDNFVSTLMSLLRES